MELTVPTPSEVQAGLRAVKTLLTLESPLNPIETKLLAAVQRHILHSDVELDRLEPIEPAALAAAIERQPVREQLLMGMVVALFASGDAQPSQLEQARAYADALAVELHELEDLRLLIERRLTLLRFDVLRRIYIGETLTNAWKHEGAAGLVERLARFKGWAEDPELAARYLALGDLPEGTLGRAYFEHCRGDGFAFPGERYGTPEEIAVHDMAHVLGGYGTDPAGEMQVAAFTAGFRKREQSLSIMLFVLCQFDLGVPMVPVAEPELGFFEPEAFMKALRRGAEMNLDLFDGWDYWAVVDQPLEVLRERYNIAV